MYPRHRQRSVGRELVEKVDTSSSISYRYLFLPTNHKLRCSPRWLCFQGVALVELDLVRYPCTAVVAGFSIGKTGRSIISLEYQLAWQPINHNVKNSEHLNLRKRIENAFTWLLASDGLILQQWGIWLLFQRSIDCADWNDQS